MAGKQDSVVTLIRDIIRKRDQTVNAIATTGPALAVLLVFVGALPPASADIAARRAVARRAEKPQLEE